MDIRSAKAEGYLGQLCSYVNEVSFNVVKVVQHEPAYRNGLQILIGRVAAHDSGIFVLGLHG
ncbi:hypothetical protein D3C74_507910 [compost metagenome]